MQNVIDLIHFKALTVCKESVTLEVGLLVTCQPVYFPLPLKQSFTDELLTFQIDQSMQGQISIQTIAKKKESFTWKMFFFESGEVPPYRKRDW